jgi:hypothetical protein
MVYRARVVSAGSKIAKEVGYYWNIANGAWRSSAAIV